MTKHFYFLSILILTSLNVDSQCMCGKMKFTLVLTGLEINNNEANYSIKTLKQSFCETNNERTFTKEDLIGDTVNFHFQTHGGIDTLQFVIKNLTNHEEMKVTVTHLRYDNPYFIELTIFTVGHFIFDWPTIDKCQKENLSANLVECAGKKFYQLQLKTDKEYSVHNKIKPVDIRDFKF
jgi:hypothetical protein